MNYGSAAMLYCVLFILYGLTPLIGVSFSSLSA